MRITATVISFLVFALTFAPGLRAQGPGLFAGGIVFVHEDTGSSEASRQIFNLRKIDLRFPSRPQSAVTRFTVPGTVVGKPVWSKDYRQLAFSANFNALFSLESNSIFSVHSDGSNLQQMTGYGMLSRFSGPTGTVVGRVLDAHNIPGSISGCIVSAQGTTKTVDCRADGSFVFENVPASSAWIRVQGIVTYQDGSPTGGPGLSLGFTDIDVKAGQVTNAGAIVINPQFTKSIEPSWSRDGSQILVTNEISARLLQKSSQGAGSEWQASTSRLLAVWDSNGTLVRSVSLPNLPSFRLTGADWSPVKDLIACGASGTSLGQSFVAVISPDGTNSGSLHQVSIDGSGPTEMITQCRWSPNGSRVAFVQLSIAPDHRTSWSDLFVVNADSTGLRKLTSNTPKQFIGTPTWSPDGQVLAFDVGISEDGTSLQQSDLFTISANGTGLARLTSDGRSFHPAWGR